MRRAVPVVFASLLAAACSSPAPDPARSGPLSAGAGQRPFDVPVGHPHAGYAQSPVLGTALPADDPGSPQADLFPATTGQQSPPSAKAVVLDNGVNRLVLARIDAVFVTDTLLDRVLALAKDRLGQDLSGELILNATHSHAAPGRFSAHSLVPELLRYQPSGARHALAHGADSYSAETTDRIASAVVGAIGDALGAMKPAVFGHATGQADRANGDRRCENDWIDGGSQRETRVTVLRLDEADTGRPIAALFHFAMHGTVSGRDNRWLSVDAPGTAEFRLEEMFDSPIVAMYLQGAAGDASPSGGGHGGSQAMQYAGWQLAHAARTTWDGITTKRDISLQVLRRRIPLSHELLGYAPGEFYEDGAALCQSFYGQCPGVPIAKADVSCVGEAVPGEGSYTTEVAAARIGDLGLVSLPGEPMFAVAKTLETQALALGGLSRVVVLGYTQDHQGYMLLDDDWLSGGYEPTISFWGWRFARYAVDQAADNLRELLTGEALARRDAAPPPEPDEAPPRVVPTDSTASPALLDDVPELAERLESVTFSFLGGDPSLGNPVVRLERRGADGTFAPWLKQGWIPVASDHGDELQISYVAKPSFKADPTATAREHRWTVHHELAPDLPVGIWRFQATFPVREKGVVRTTTLVTRGFEVKPSSHLQLEATLRADGGRLVFDATLLLPSRPAVFSATNGAQQIDGFRLVNPAYPNNFAPVKALSPGSAVARCETHEVPLAFTAIETVNADRYRPGEGPGLHAEASVSPGHWRVTIPAGTLVDAFGNTHATAFAYETDVGP